MLNLVSYLLAIVLDLIFALDDVIPGMCHHSGGLQARSFSVRDKSCVRVANTPQCEYIACFLDPRPFSIMMGNER